MEPALLLVAIAATVAGGAAFLMVLFLWKLASPNRREPVTADWLGRFSLEKYRPMQRLLAEEDFQYLAAQEYSPPWLAARLRRQRIQAFRGYLKWLSNDYRRLEAALLLLMANSPNDRPDLARDLLKRRLTFSFAILAAEWRLVLFRFGATPGDVSRLVAVLDDMRGDLCWTALARQASLA